MDVMTSDEEELARIRFFRNQIKFNNVEPFANYPLDISMQRASMIFPHHIHTKLGE